MGLIATLKKLNDNLPDPVKMAFAPVIRKQLVNNKTFLEQYAELENLDSMTEVNKSAYCFNKLKEMLVFAYENTAFYKSCFDRCGFDPYTMESAADMDCIPFITKADVQAHFDEMQASVVTDYYAATTGGSTGKPLHIQLDRASIYCEKAYIYHYWSKAGYNYKTDRVATFRGVEFSGGEYSKLNPLYNEIFLNPFVLNSDNVDEYVSIIEKFGAKFIHGYPSAIAHFCKLVKSTGLVGRLKMQAVFFISENVLPEHFDIVREVLYCESYPFYGHSERSVFAEFNPKDACYYPNERYCRFETDEDGEIVCTGLVNKRMPLIRYKTDDFAYTKADGGFKIVGHHSSNVLYGKNGEEISLAAINFHSLAFDRVDAYQFEQFEQGRTIMRIVVNKLFADSDMEAVKTALNKKLGDKMDVEVKIVQKIQLTARGKHNMIIQHVSRHAK